MLPWEDRPLFVFEMANNHDGDVSHGVAIIAAMAEVSRAYTGFQFAFKMQFRELDTFIHPDFKDRMDLKYIKRFSDTRLSGAQFEELKEAIKAHNFLAMCTPFDEASVGTIEKLGFDILKIASCSFTDWPLLERIAASSLPVIASTAGASSEDIDRVVSFFGHRQRPLALMHCVAAYPTADGDLQLNQLDLMQARYPGTTIGYSTHESPDNTRAVMLAAAKGARIFEKHVGLPEGEHKLNAYSASPRQVAAWLAAAHDAYGMCGLTQDRPPLSDAELRALHGLRRGLWAKAKIARGQRVVLDNTFLAIPLQDQQVSANDFSKYLEYRADADIEAGEAITLDMVTRTDTRGDVYGIVQDVRKLLKESNVRIPGAADLEISHHYGIDRFYEFGTTLITVINREYCKKLIIALGGQVHPEQYHHRKEETFHVLYGEVAIALDGVEKVYGPGDVVVVEREVRHRFTSERGAVLEEISSSHYKDDSFYTDGSIMENEHRKTVLTYWMD